MIRTNYGGQFRYEGKTITFGLAREEDAAQIAALYQQIAIHERNYKTRLKRDCLDSFEKKGGMYEILSQKEILREIEKDTSLFAVAKDENGKVVSSFWFAEMDPHLSFYVPDRMKFQDKMEIYSAILKAKAEGKMVYPRELIVSLQDAPPKIALLMFYSIFVAMERLGYTHSLCEVYKVISYIDKNGEKTINMLNERSFSMTTRAGGEFIDTMPLRSVCFPGLKVNIEAQVFYFDYHKLLPMQEAYFKENRIQVIWGDKHEKRNQAQDL